MGSFSRRAQLHEWWWWIVYVPAVANMAMVGNIEDVSEKYKEIMHHKLNTKFQWP
jgi:hypothetical protein